MPRVLVHFHVYYHDQVPYFLEKLANINGCEWELYVTYSQENPQTNDAIKAFKPDAHFMQVENVGYDVWPFIKLIKSLDISKFDYVLKVHTKTITYKTRKTNYIRFSGSTWRDLLVDALLKSPEKFARNLSILEQDPKIGIIYSYALMRTCEDYSALLKQAAAEIGLDIHNRKFCAGTMFLARISPFGRLKDIEINAEDFGDSHKTAPNSTPAHFYERFFCIMVEDAGYSTKLVSSHPKADFGAHLHGFLSKIDPGLKNIFALERDPDSERKYMILLGFRIYLEKQGRKNKN